MIGGVNYKGHRLAWLYMTGCWPLDEVDHVNQEKSDDRWINLRAVTHKQNAQNTPVHRHSKTQVKGVHFDARRKRYHAYIDHAGKREHLGRFIHLSEAEQARKQAEDRVFTHHRSHT
jgi:hypothetical protein